MSDDNPKDKRTSKEKRAPDRVASTRDRIVEVAVHLFYEKGYEATGMAEILQRAQANSGSFYYFFKSKEDLLLAVLDWYEKNVQPLLIEPVCAQTKDPIERVFALLEGYRQSLMMTGCTFGCPIGRLALEIAPERLEVHGKLAKNFGNWLTAVRKFLDDAGERLPKGLNRAELAQFILTVMEGAVMQSRSFRNIEPFDASIRQLRQYFDGLQVAAAEEGHQKREARKRQDGGKNRRGRQGKTRKSKARKA